MSAKTKDVLIRATKTLWQAALGSFMVSLPTIIELIPEGWECLKPILISALVGALAAGVSAAWNGVFAPLWEKFKAKQVVLDDCDLLSDEDKGDIENETSESGE